MAEQSKLEYSTKPLDPLRPYTIEELSEVLNVDRRIIRSNLADKKQDGIKYARFGRQYRILGQDVASVFGTASFMPETTEKQIDTIGVPPLK